MRTANLAFPQDLVQHHLRMAYTSAAWKIASFEVQLALCQLQY